MKIKAVHVICSLLIVASIALSLCAATQPKEESQEKTPLGSFEKNPEALLVIAPRLTYDELVRLASTSASIYLILLPEMERRKELIKYWTESKIVKVAETSEGRLAIYNVNLSPDGTKVVYDAGGNIYIWDIVANKKLKFKGYDKAIISPDGTMLAARSSYPFHRIDLLDFKNNTIIKSREFKNHINAFSFSPNGKILGINLVSDPITLWDLNSDTLKNLPWQAGTYDLSFSHDSTMLAARPNHKLIIWGINIGKDIAHFEEFFKNALDFVIFSPDNETVAIGVDYDGILWNFRTNKTKKFKMSEPSLAFSPDGMMLAAIIDSDHIGLFNAHTGQEIKKIETGDLQPTKVEFSPNGKMLVVASGRTIECWQQKEK